MDRLFSIPITDLGECATGHHAWHTTLVPGKAVCMVCGTLGYCLYCAATDIPPGAPLRACRFHRHNSTPLVDSLRPLSAFTRGDAIV